MEKDYLIINCENFEDFLSAYYEKSLNSEEKSYFEKHLESCPSCKEKYDAFIDMMSTLKNCEEVEVPADFHINLMENLERTLLTNSTLEYSNQIEQTEQKENKFLLFINKLMSFENKKLIYSGGLACLVLTFGLLFSLSNPSKNFATESSESSSYNESEEFYLGESESIEEPSSELKKSPRVTKASEKRSDFTPYEYEDNLVSNTLFLQLDDSQKKSQKLFEKISADENVKVLNQSLGTIYSNMNGTSTYTAEEFLNLVDDKNIEYSYNTFIDNNTIEYYNSIMTATSNKINFLEQSKNSLDSQKDINKVEEEIISLEKNMQKFATEAEKILSTKDLVLFNFDVQNKSDIWKDGFFNSVIKDFTFAINNTFILLVVLTLITIGLFIVKFTLKEDFESIVLIRGALITKLFSFVVIFIFLVVSFLYSFNEYKYSTYAFRSTNEISEYSYNAFDGKVEVEVDESKDIEQIAYSGYISTEVAKLSKAVNETKKILEEYDVVLVNSNSSNGNSIFKDFTLKVLKEDYDEVYSKLSTIGTISNSWKNEINHSTVIDEVDEEINSNQELRNSYVKTLEQSTNVENILSLTNQIYNYDVDIYNNNIQLEQLKEEVLFGNIYLTITEKESDFIFLQNDFFVKAFHIILLVIASLITFAISFAIPLVIAIYVRKFYNKIFKIKE